MQAKLSKVSKYMWDTETKIFGKISQTKKTHLEKLIKSFFIPNKGLAIVLDEMDCECHRSDKWSGEGLHMNLKMCDMEIEVFPDFVKSCIGSQEYANLIWIALKTCIGSDFQFVGILAHEMQHYVQDRKSHILSQVNEFMLDYFLYGAHKIKLKKIDIPYEFDAEIKAFEEIKDRIGIEEAKTYITQGENSEALSKFLKHDFNTPYPILNETISLYKRHQEQLQNYSDEKRFHIDEKILMLEKMTQ